MNRFTSYYFNQWREPPNLFFIWFLLFVPVWFWIPNAFAAIGLPMLATVLYAAYPCLGAVLFLGMVFAWIWLLAKRRWREAFYSFLYGASVALVWCVFFSHFYIYAAILNSMNF